MPRSFKFAIIRLAPDDVRGERINIGVLVGDGSSIEVHLSKRLEKIRAISNAIDPSSVRAIAESLPELDLEFQRSGLTNEDARLAALKQIGPISLSDFGLFSAHDAAAYESRIQAILTNFVDPEPAPRRVTLRRTRLITQVRNMFRQEKVLALKEESLGSHRIVPGLELADGLVADFALQNGAMHVVKTVDASSEGEQLRKVVADIAVSALTLEQARINFGVNSTRTKLVYDASATLEMRARPSLQAAEHQGAELVNWASKDDQRKFITAMSSLAEPLEKYGKGQGGPSQFGPSRQRRMLS